MRLLITGLLITFAITVSAQTRVFRWQDEFCTYEGTYDAEKATQRQLRDTLKLSQPGSFSLSTNTIAWTWDDIARLDVAAYDREYAQISAELKALKIVRTPYWIKLYDQKLEELNSVYRLNRVTMRAYSDPNVLAEYGSASACSQKFADPMIKGGEDLLAVWKAVNIDSRTKNSDPQRLRAVYEEHLRSPDKFRFALLEVMNFGWSNCANELIRYVEYDGTPEKEFKKLFRRTKRISCDEP